MSTVRVAILGAAGWMGKVHTMAFQTFPHFMGTAQGTARIEALVASTPAAAAEIAARVPGARVLPDWQAAVKDPDVDLIDICLPDSLHYPVAKAALLEASTSIAKNRWPIRRPRRGNWRILPEARG